MTHPDYPRVAAATSFLGRLLAGISLTDLRPTPDDGEELVPDVALDTTTADVEARAVSTIATLPSGDRYRISVEWLGDNEAHRG